MPHDDNNLDYTKIRDAMDAAAELLKKKKEETLAKKEDELTTKREAAKYDDEVRQPLYKKILFIGLFVIFAIFILLLIIYLFTRSSSKPEVVVPVAPSVPNVIPPQPFPIPINNANANNTFTYNDSSSIPITTIPSSLPPRMNGGRRMYKNKFNK
jgi:hypothetical protein